MKRVLLLLIILLAITSIAAIAQEKEAPKEDMSSMAPPKPLEDEISKWMIGEWAGTSESNMGTSKDWQKNEWSLDKQYVTMHLTSKMTKVNEDHAKKMAGMMKMSEKEFMDMMKNSEYKGMGLMTLDPQTGEYVGYWFDSWRGFYKGRGKLDGKIVTINWEGTMGTSVRTIEIEGPDKMVQSFKENMMGDEMVGKSTYTRKKK